MAMLEVNEIHSYYGNIHALKGVSLTVDKGEIVTLIGANGAGKTTTLKTISGSMHPRQGTIILDGEPIDHLPPHEVVVRGIGP
jgi:branched-chain amino acid transport system ATP-binding protein